jgi:hypothetical protein
MIVHNTTFRQKRRLIKSTQGPLHTWLSSVPPQRYRLKKTAGRGRQCRLLGEDDVGVAGDDDDDTAKTMPEASAGRGLWSWCRDWGPS